MLRRLSFNIRYHLFGWLRLLTKGGRRRFAQNLADGGDVVMNVMPPLWLLIYSLIVIVSIKVFKELGRFWRRVKNGRYGLDGRKLARK